MPAKNKFAGARIIIAEHYPIFSKALAFILQQKFGYTHCRVVSQNSELLPLLTKTKTDLLLLDLELPGNTAWQILETVKTKPAAGKVIVLNTTGNDDTVLHAFYAGADAYLTKDITENQLGHTITEVMKHGFAIDERQFKLLAQNHEPIKQPGSQPVLQLTDDEARVFVLVQEKMIYEEIAGKLGFSKRWVEERCRTMIKKVQGKNMRDVLVYATANGWEKETASSAAAERAGT